MSRLCAVICAFIVMGATVISSGCVGDTGTDQLATTPTATVTPTNTQAVEARTPVSTTEPAPAPSLAQYEDTRYGWKVSYPKGWAVEEFSDPKKIYDVGINLYSPDTMMIVIQARKTADTLDAATKHYVQGMENLAKIDANVTVLKSYEKITLSGLPAYRFEARYSADNETVRQVHLITVHDVTTYQIGMYEFEEKYLDSVNEFNAIIDSFEVVR